MKCYIGYANNEYLRERASSGGVVTALLLYLLDTNRIDGAIVVRMNKLEVEQFIARSREEVLNASQSKYMDFSLSKIVQEVKQANENFAIVGLPCHFKALKNITDFNQKIDCWFGLMCGCNLKKEGTFAILRKLKVRPEDVERIEYRAGKRYGGFLVILKDGHTKFVSKDAFNYLFTIYMPNKCIECKDFFCEHCDINFGDCWFKENYTSILVRNKKGESLLKECADAGHINLEVVNDKDFFNQYRHSVSLKKKRADSRRYKFFVEITPLKILEFEAKIMKFIRRYI